MEIANKILSDITVHMKYARYLEDANRRENWAELVRRNACMHCKEFPHLIEEIDAAYEYVLDKKVLPSMRSMQFAGKPIEVSPNRIFNCAFCPIDDFRVFGEIMFLLLGGTGVGFSVQKHHVEKLPPIRKPNTKRSRRFLIGDSIEGWSDAVTALLKSYFRGTSRIRFDFSDIRPKGSKSMILYVTLQMLFWLVVSGVLLLFLFSVLTMKICLPVKQAIGQNGILKGVVLIILLYCAAAGLMNLCS